MLLKEKILELVRESDDQMSNKQHIQRAEKLSDKFKDVEPETYSVPMEKYFGLPAHQTDKKA